MTDARDRRAGTGVGSGRSRTGFGEGPRTRPLLERVTYGTVGGVVATLSMTTFRIPTSRSLPPTADFWAKFVGGGEPADYPLVGLLLHFAYGIGAGIAFATVAPGRGEPEVLAETKNAVTGTVFGILLSVFGTRVVLGRLLGVHLEPDERLVFHLGHVVYGLTLGTWVGSRLAAD